MVTHILAFVYLEGAAHIVLADLEISGDSVIDVVVFDSLSGGSRPVLANRKDALSCELSALQCWVRHLIGPSSAFPLPEAVAARQHHLGVQTDGASCGFFAFSAAVSRLLWPWDDLSERTAIDRTPAAGQIRSVWTQFVNRLGPTSTHTQGLTWMEVSDLFSQLYAPVMVAHAVGPWRRAQQDDSAEVSPIANAETDLAGLSDVHDARYLPHCANRACTGQIAISMATRTLLEPVTVCARS